MVQRTYLKQSTVKYQVFGDLNFSLRAPDDVKPPSQHVPRGVGGGASAVPWCARRGRERLLGDQARSRVVDAVLCLSVWVYELCGCAERRSSPRRRHRAGTAGCRSWHCHGLCVSARASAAPFLGSLCGAGPWDRRCGRSVRLSASGLQEHSP